jgi:hypothetical protein
MTPFFVVLVGLLVRIVLPLLLMTGLVSLLRRLDARWQAEARHQQELANEDTEIHLLKLNECAIDGISKKLSVQSNEPCWQHFRKNNGYLHEECLHCKVFRAVPILLPNN